MSSQLDRAYALINQLKTQFSVLSTIQEELRIIVGDAQNAPPEGKADGSIDVTTWTQLHETERALSTLLLTLLFHGQSTTKPEQLSDAEIDTLLR